MTVVVSCYPKADNRLPLPIYVDALTYISSKNKNQTKKHQWEVHYE